MTEVPSNSYHPKTRAEWRQWLGDHHTQKEGVWCISFKKESGEVPLGYDEVVEEDLATAFTLFPTASDNFGAFPRSVKRGITEGNKWG